jgi:hypothetical protein
MLFAIAVLVAVSGALIIDKARVAGRVNQASLGWMSAQWLAEHRASHLRLTHLRFIPRLNANRL